MGWLADLRSLLTTDGDLITRTSGTPARVTRATLAADSAFSALYAGFASVPPLVPAVSDYLHVTCGGRGTATLTASRVHYTPIWLPVAMTLDRIGCELVTAAGATGVMRLGIYEHDTSDQRPGALVVDAGTVDGSASAGAKTITISEALAAGLYWLAGVAQGADAALPTWRTVVTPQHALPVTATPTGSGQSIAHIEAGVTGALTDPSPVGGSGITTVAPLLYVRRSA